MVCHLVTAPANAIYTYQVRAKGIDIVQSPDEDEVCRPCAVGYLCLDETPW